MKRKGFSHISTGHVIRDIGRRHPALNGKKFDGICCRCGSRMIYEKPTKGRNLGHIYVCTNKNCNNPKYPDGRTRHHVLPWER